MTDRIDCTLNDNTIYFVKWLIAHHFSIVNQRLQRAEHQQYVHLDGEEYIQTAVTPIKVFLYSWKKTTISKL